MAIYILEKMNPGIDTPSWMSTTNNVNICAESHGLSSLWKMIDKNGNTSACVSFVYQVPLEAKKSILDELVINVRDKFRRSFLKRKKNTVGEFILMYVDTLPKGTKGELQALCLKKGAGDNDGGA